MEDIRIKGEVSWEFSWGPDDFDGCRKIRVCALGSTFSPCATTAIAAKRAKGIKRWIAIAFAGGQDYCPRGEKVGIINHWGIHSLLKR